MAKAKPIVAFDVEGVNEAVVDQQTGFLAPFGDTEQFAQKTRLLIESRDLAQEMGRRGLQTVRDRYDIGQTVEKLEALYLDIAQNNNGLRR
jgi:glycosyltransferase involved in cell wall biosynthesis